MDKVAKNDLTSISKPQTHPHTMKKTHAKIGTKMLEELRSHAVPTVYILRVKND